MGPACGSAVGSIEAPRVALLPVNPSTGPMQPVGAVRLVPLGDVYTQIFEDEVKNSKRTRQGKAELVVLLSLLASKVVVGKQR